MAYSKLILGVNQQRFKKKCCWATVSENLYVIDDNFCTRILNDKKEQQKLIFPGHTHVPSTRLEDLKTLSHSVQVW